MSQSSVVNHSLRSHKLRENERREIAIQLQAFLASGGRIEQLTQNVRVKDCASRALARSDSSVSFEPY